MPAQYIPARSSALSTAVFSDKPNAAGIQFRSDLGYPQVKFGSTVYNLLVVAAADHAKINVVDQTKTIRLNSQNYTVTSGEIIGFQAKPAAAAAGTTTTYGGQISPRYANAVTGTSLYGLQIEPILQGASAAALSGDVVGLYVRLSATGTGHTVAGK